mgnify:FL=1
MRALFRSALPLVCVVCSACSGVRQPEQSASAPQPSAAVPQYPSPTQPFSAPQPWKPTQGDGQAVQPPQASEYTWHALVDQYEPHQKPTPQWQPLPAAETVEIAMPPGSSLRCIAPPLKIEAEPEESGRSLESWQLSREVLCTSDGFHTWNAYAYSMRLLPDGKRELSKGSDIWLRERASDGTILHTKLSVRAEALRREATVGPPQVLTERK